MVVGGIRSWKSSLAAAITGDVERVNGTVCVRESSAFCPQITWINNNTVRGNTSDVAHVCGLDKDLQTLTDPVCPCGVLVKRHYENARQALGYRHACWVDADGRVHFGETFRKEGKADDESDAGFGQGRYKELRDAGLVTTADGHDTDSTSQSSSTPSSTLSNAASPFEDKEKAEKAARQIVVESVTIFQNYWLGVVPEPTMFAPLTFHWKLGVYGLLTVLSMILLMLYACVVGCSTHRSNRMIRDKLLRHVMRCPVSFFDTTPLRRVINRFGGDIAQTDMDLVAILYDVYLLVVGFVRQIVIIAISTPSFLGIGLLGHIIDM
ncbi:hypothetical protein BLNAU_21931 [Blattamonas nauphoetae]|uniref:ABC transmembrane type-1 domain-containing protein n=1 Tax=Blattamonas nauphoetae TaxID=2049346 RepID=A0ABQ9WUI4_9EUKA|nr:hypothetical protein BLNAU_21931 [Blattamonas nauphoetae]